MEGSRHYGGVVRVDGVENSVVCRFGYVVGVQGKEQGSQGRALRDTGCDGVSGGGDVVAVASR